jgi:predicted porin
MRIEFKPLTAALLAIGFASGAAHGQSMPTFKLSGFGTIAAAHSSERNADFITHISQPNGAGFTSATSFNPDSKVGVQGDMQFTDKLSGVVQLVSQHNWDNGYTPEVEWANVKYQATPDLALRVGRIAMPFFMYSDTRLVGYAQPWVRPPIEVYMVQPNTKSDGADVMYRAQTGSVTHNLQAFYGVNEVKTPDGGSAKGNPNWGFNDTAQMGDLTMRGAFTYSRVSIPALQGLTDALGAFSGIPGPIGAESARLASVYKANDMDFRTVAVGASYDPGSWFLTGEYLDFRGQSFAQGTQAWYISGGYRIGKFTPYATYSGSKNHTKQEAGIPFPPAQPLNDALNSIINNPNKQNTISAGLRWDFMRNVDLKAQYDHISLGEGSTGRFTNIQPAFKPGGHANIFTVSVDFVF